MNKQQKITLIDDLIGRIGSLLPLDYNGISNLKKETEMIIRNIVEESSSGYIDSINNIRFSPSAYPASPSLELDVWHSGIEMFLGLLGTIKREIELFSIDIVEKMDEIKSEQATTIKTNKVFIVHGHDDAMKLDVARTIEKLKLEAIILHEQDDEGKTVIEKFESNAIDCNFAVILLSPDDMAFPKGKEEDTKYRARQNVILELGYFIGSIGRKSVLTLVKDDPSSKLEIPSDYAGVVYTQYDGNGGWKSALVKALKANGYSVDANDLF